MCCADQRQAGDEIIFSELPPESSAAPTRVATELRFTLEHDDVADAPPCEPPGGCHARKAAADDRDVDAAWQLVHHGLVAHDQNQADSGHATSDSPRYR